MTWKRWSIAEDELVCRFYLEHPNKATADFKQIKAEFERLGYERSIGTLKARYLNYQYLATGKGLSHYNKWQCEVFTRIKRGR